MVDLDRIDKEYLRKAEFLGVVAVSRTRVIVAERELRDATLKAQRAGCTSDEIAGAIRMVERAAS